MVENNSALQEVYIGNKAQKAQCQELLDKVPPEEELSRILF